MYLLLAIGITFGVVFVGGALLGFVAGFLDAFSDASDGSTDTKSLIACGTLVLTLIASIVLHWVFLRSGFSSYTLGRIPQGTWWKVILPLMITGGGIALLYMMIGLYGHDRLATGFPQIMKEKPLQMFICWIAFEAAADLVIYGAVLREILEWKHRPQVIIPVFLMVMTLLSLIGLSSPWLLIPVIVMSLIEAWTFECTRSFVPILSCDIVFGVIYVLVPEPPFSWWIILLATVLIVLPSWYLVRLMDRFRPID